MILLPTQNKERSGIVMDTGQGRFEMTENLKSKLDDLQETYPNHGGVFRVGEQIELKGSKFRIKAIKPTELRLKLLNKAGGS